MPSTWGKWASGSWSGHGTDVFGRVHIGQHRETTDNETEMLEGITGQGPGVGPGHGHIGQHGDGGRFGDTQGPPAPVGGHAQHGLRPGDEQLVDRPTEQGSGDLRSVHPDLQDGETLSGRVMMGADQAVTEGHPPLRDHDEPLEGLENLLTPAGHGQVTAEGDDPGGHR